MRRVLFTATLLRGHISKFHIPYLKWFKEQGWETWVAAQNDYLEGDFDIPFCDHFVQIDFARSPFSPNTFHAYKQLKELFDNHAFDIVHTHTPVGSVLTRLAARDSRKSGTSVIYTAHGFHFYHGAPIQNWILWYPVEKFMSTFTDVLITINKEDYRRGASSFNCKVAYLPGVGVDLSRFGRVGVDYAFRKTIGVSDDEVLVFAAGDLNRNKNHAVLIRALAGLDDKYRLVIAGEGDFRERLQGLAEECGVADRVDFVGFRTDIDRFLKSADVYCLPSLREGLPVSLLEALCCGVPSLASDIRGCVDLVEASCGLGVSVGSSHLEWANAIEQASRKSRNIGELPDSLQRYAINRVLESYRQLLVDNEFF